MATRTRYIVGFTVLSVLAAFLLPAMPQPVAYHDFADHREMLGVANFFDVASNAAFLLAGLAGLAVTVRPRTEFAANRERWPYAVFFAGMVLTGLGSAYYHLVPDNERLFWDRLPMTIAFMSLIAAQVVDRIDTKTGLACWCRCCWSGRPRSSTGGRRSGRVPAMSCLTPCCRVTR